MEQIKMENEYRWVLNVLKSSKTKSHVESSINLFNLFIDKWSEYISDSIYEITYIYEFNKIKEEIQKNNNIFVL